MEAENLEQAIGDKLEQCLGNPNEFSEQKDSMQFGQNESIQRSEIKQIENKYN